MTTATPTATHDIACSSDMAGTPPSTKHLPIAARQPAEVVREYGPFGGASTIHGVTHDGQCVWAATGEHLVGFDPASGATTRTLHVVCDAGTGGVVATTPARGGGNDSGLTWAEGSLWVGQYRDRKIHQIDPATGAIRRTIESNRFVTGVTWVDGELWHGTWEGEESTLRHIDPTSGAVLQQLDMPQGVGVSGLESDGAGLFYCGGGGSGKVRAVRRPGAHTPA